MQLCSKLGLACEIGNSLFWLPIPCDRGVNFSISLVVLKEYFKSKPLADRHNNILIDIIFIQDWATGPGMSLNNQKMPFITICSLANIDAMPSIFKLPGM